MKKLYTKLKKRLGKEKENVKKYFMTLIMIAITTLSVVILGFENDHSKLYLALVFICVLTFIVDTLYTDKKKKCLMYILSVILAILSSQMLISNELGKAANSAILGIYITLFLAAIYKLAKEEGLSKFLNKVIGNNIILGITSSVIQSGLAFIIVIIASLFTESDSLFINIELLFLGLFIIPAELLCITSKSSLMPEKFMEGLIKYIMLPIIITINAIIYIYLLKILVTFNMPSNEIFKIVFGLFVIGFPTWLLCNNFKLKNKLIINIHKYLPIVFIPLIILQIYSLLIRIISRGFTISRYFGIYIIIFEIISLYYSISNREHISRVVLYLSGIMFITFCIPYLNMFDVAYTSQLKRLEKIYPNNTIFDNLSPSVKKDVQNIYNYLNYTLDMEDRLPSYIEREKIEDYNPYYYSEPEKKYDTINYDNYTPFIHVTDYDYIIPIDIHEYGNDYKKTLDDFDFYDTISNQKNDELVDSIKLYLASVLISGEVKPAKDDIIILDDDLSLYIESLSIRYIKDTNEIDYINLTGYFLKKMPQKSNEN